MFLAFLAKILMVATFLWVSMLQNSGAVPAMAEEKTAAVTIIMYHSLLPEEGKAGEFVVTPQQFEDDIRFLVENGYEFVTINDLINYVNRRWARLPERAVMITFDDGYYNNYLFAYPIAQQYNARFVLSVLGYFTDIIQENEVLNKNYSHVTWEQIREMHESGLVEIQNHSYNLHKSSKQRYGSAKRTHESLGDYRKALADDLTKMQQLLKENSGVSPNAFVYPFGKVSPESVEILRDLGFEAALTCAPGINHLRKGDLDQLFSLKRFNRPHGKSSAEFFKDKLAH